MVTREENAEIIARSKLIKKIANQVADHNDETLRRLSGAVQRSKMSLQDQKGSIKALKDYVDE
jgi:hypothetical protein